VKRKGAYVDPALAKKGLPTRNEHKYRRPIAYVSSTQGKSARSHLPAPAAVPASEAAQPMAPGAAPSTKPAPLLTAHEAATSLRRGSPPSDVGNRQPAKRRRSPGGDDAAATDVPAEPSEGTSAPAQSLPSGEVAGDAVATVEGREETAGGDEVIPRGDGGYRKRARTARTHPTAHTVGLPCHGFSPSLSSSSSSSKHHNLGKYFLSYSNSGCLTCCVLSQHIPLPAVYRAFLSATVHLPSDVL